MLLRIEIPGDRVPLDPAGLQNACSIGWQERSLDSRWSLGIDMLSDRVGTFGRRMFS